jgi:hypothetical protein
LCTGYSQGSQQTQSYQTLSALGKADNKLPAMQPYNAKRCQALPSAAKPLIPHFSSPISQKFSWAENGGFCSLKE